MSHSYWQRGGFLSFALWRAACATGAALVWRAPATVMLPILERYADGSYHSELRWNQASGDQTGPRDVYGAAAQRRCVPARVQRRAAARSLGPDDTGLALHHLTSAVPVAPAGPRVPRHFRVKTITTAGTFRFGKRIVYLAHALTNQRFGMEETDDGLWQLRFRSVLLATFDERDYIIQS